MCIYEEVKMLPVKYEKITITRLQGVEADAFMWVIQRRNTTNEPYQNVADGGPCACYEDCFTALRDTLCNLAQVPILNQRIHAVE